MSKINETNYPRRTQANYEDTDMLVIQEADGNTYTTRIEDLREDCQETLAPALNTMRENLATVEGSTASKAYAKGDFLVFGGRLCKAKTSIASGATLVLDTNIELDSVGDELTSLTSDLASLYGVDPDLITYVNGYYTLPTLTAVATIAQQLLSTIQIKSGTMAVIRVLVLTNSVWQVDGYCNASKTAAALTFKRFDGSFSMFYRSGGTDTVKDVVMN